MINEDIIEKFFCGLLLLLCAIFIGCIVLIGVKYQKPNDDVRKIHLIGHYEIDGVQEDIQSHIVKGKLLGAKHKRYVIFRGHFDEDLLASDELFLYMHNVKMVLKQNGKEIYRYGFKESHPSIVKSNGIDWARIKIDGISKEDEVEISLEAVYNGIHDKIYGVFLENMYTGDYHDFIVQQVHKNIVNIVISTGLIICGIIYLSGLILVKIIQKSLSFSYASCGLVMITGAICSLLDYSYITLLFNNTFIITIVDYLSCMMMVVLLMIYFRTYLMSESYIYWSRKLIHYGGNVVVAYLILQLTGLASEVKFLEVLFGIEIGFIVVVFCLLVSDYRKYRDWKIQRVMISCSVLGICTLIERVYYWGTGMYAQWIFTLGVCYFAISQINSGIDHIREQMNKVKKAEQLEKELIQSRITIMLSQIQPHFLFNALTSIQELCLIDVGKAHEALKRFSHFLRGNMDSLTATSLIPFDKELQHIKDYLYIEEMRYGEYIRVSYEIQVVDFFIPALSIQPIVENAVRYGIGKKEEGGTVSISTYENEESYEILIQDDGVGFDVEEKMKEIKVDSKRNHVGIENVRNRLEAQCGGKMEVTSEVGKGTKVTINIPKEKSKNEHNCSR